MTSSLQLMTYVPFRQRLASSESTTLAIKLANRLTGPAFFDVAKPRRAIAIAAAAAAAAAPETKGRPISRSASLFAIIEVAGASPHATKAGPISLGGRWR